MSKQFSTTEAERPATKDADPANPDAEAGSLQRLVRPSLGSYSVNISQAKELRKAACIWQAFVRDTPLGKRFRFDFYPARLGRRQAEAFVKSLRLIKPVIVSRGKIFGTMQERCECGMIGLGDNPAALRRHKCGNMVRPNDPNSPTTSSAEERKRDDR